MWSPHHIDVNNVANVDGEEKWFECAMKEAICVRTRRLYVSE